MKYAFIAALLFRTNKHESWASVKHIILIFLVIYFPSCYPARIPLSPEEEKLGAALAREYRCEVHLEHSYYSVSAKESDGTFFVRLESKQRDLCSKDSSYFRTTSLKIANDVIGTISHKENYRFINIVFHVDKNTGTDSFQTLCVRELEIDIDSTGDPAIRNWWTPKEYEWAPSDHIIEK